MDKELVKNFTELHFKATKCIENLSKGLEFHEKILKRFIEMQLEFDSILIKTLANLDNGQESMKIDMLERMVNNAKK